MSISRERLHEMIDIVDAAEFEVIFQVLAKFITEDAATPDEIEAIRIGREEFQRGEYTRHEDIDWN